ncbi:prepilin peptidase [Oleidesulfovibrio alaskensis]
MANRVCLSGIWMLAAVSLHSELTAVGLASFVLTGLLVAEAASIDSQSGLLPDRLLLPAFLFALPAAWYLRGFPTAFIGATLAAIPFFCLSFCNRIGMGDAKLVFIMGLFMPVLHSYYMLILTCLSLLIAGLHFRRKEVYGGPFIVLSTVFVLLFGNEIQQAISL